MVLYMMQPIIYVYRKILHCYKIFHVMFYGCDANIVSFETDLDNHIGLP
jgi:hypothetical protein